jgi:hypothetical protein
LTKEDEVFFSAVEKWDDFLEGKFDGITPEEMKILQDLDEKGNEFAAFLDSPECAELYGEDDDCLKNAPGCPVEADYFPAKKGAFDGELYAECVSKAVGDDADEEPDYF